MVKGFTIKKGSTTPPLETQLVDGNGDAVDLTTATSVSFKMKAVDPGVSKTVTGNATVIDSTLGKVGFYWSSGNTDTVGHFAGEFTVMWNTKPEVFPSDRYVPIEVFEVL